jgi:ribosomal protein S2
MMVAFFKLKFLFATKTIIALSILSKSSLVHISNLNNGQLFNDLPERRSDNFSQVHLFSSPLNEGYNSADPIDVAPKSTTLIRKASLPKEELTAYRSVLIGEAGVQFAFSQLLGANLHLGHRSIAVDPRGMENMLGLRNDLYVINLLKSVQPLKAALHVLSVVIAKRAKALFTNFDRRALPSLVGPMLNFCFRYVLTARKWPGVLTNFIHIRHRERALRTSFQVPSYAYAVRRYDHHLTAEANILNIPSMTVYDSDTNPLATAFYPVSANDETLTSRLLFTRLFFRSIHDGHQKFLTGWVRRRSFFLTGLFTAFHRLYYRYRSGSFLYENFFRNQFLSLFSPADPLSLFVNSDSSFSLRLYRLHLKLLLLDNLKSCDSIVSSTHNLKPIFFSSFNFGHFGFFDNFSGVDFSSIESRGSYFSPIASVRHHEKSKFSKVVVKPFGYAVDELWQASKSIVLGSGLVNCRADRFIFLGYNTELRSPRLLRTHRLKLLNYLRLRASLQTKLLSRYRSILALQWQDRFISYEEAEASNLPVEKTDLSD